MKTPAPEDDKPLKAVGGQQSLASASASAPVSPRKAAVKPSVAPVPASTLLPAGGTSIGGAQPAAVNEVGKNAASGGLSPLLDNTVGASGAVPAVAASGPLSSQSSALPAFVEAPHPSSGTALAVPPPVLAPAPAAAPPAAAAPPKPRRPPANVRALWGQGLGGGTPAAAPAVAAAEPPPPPAAAEGSSEPRLDGALPHGPTARGSGESLSSEPQLVAATATDSARGTKASEPKGPVAALQGSVREGLAVGVKGLGPVVDARASTVTGGQGVVDERGAGRASPGPGSDQSAARGPLVSLGPRIARLKQDWPIQVKIYLPLLIPLGSECGG